MDIERIIGFVVTSVVIFILKSFIKFGTKLLVIALTIVAVVYFAMPELLYNFIGNIKDTILHSVSYNFNKIIRFTELLNY